MKNMQKGFTLIELMIVVAIIAILAAIAIPAYQDYLVRSQVSEASTLADGAKTAIAEYYSNTGGFPPSNVSAGLAPDNEIIGKYVKDVNVGTKTGIIVVEFGNSANTAIASSTFSLSAITHAGSIEWSCKNTTYTTVLAKYLPTSCRQ
ncbi:pilin [Rhodanobacter sp. C05]|uniref:pilin n=1 Tax=Rhodanobacter sp. C05 TaxID=1945855 RepID=UPI000985A678|nr:pilin [Rhodanobacter sp. C05]OOG42486.1 prepilin-type N-terminal cleavage/methylation domain-containing protein [Rhodanobacter sp. C05]